MASPYSRTDDPEAAVAHRIGEWAKRLLQLDRRNNLLYFRPGRSAVGITGIAPDQLERRLRRARGLQFPYAPPARSRRRGFPTQDDPVDPNALPIRAGDVETDCEPTDLQRRLRSLQRREREWQEEQGLSVLFLAMGFLNWVDEDGEQARSPVLLRPCRLERDSPRDAFRLVRGDDDPVVNPTLRHQLTLSGTELPELENESAEDEPFGAYVDRVGALTRPRVDWSVDSAIFVGTFSYSKLAMYEDLTRMQEQGVRSELTRLLAGSASPAGGAAPEAAPPPADELAGGALDDLLDLRDQYTVLPADFSQLGAVEEARQGRNLVVHGPPGTGKSQTIANLIATLVADGKRVLFVSEKTAALDVVKRRLEECNLGVFCLDLHSDRGRKSEVYRQLSSAVNDQRERLAASVSIDELLARRDRLNRIVRVLHERREPLGKSVYEVQGVFAKERHLPRCEALRVPSSSQLTANWIRDVERIAERIARRPEEFRSHHSSRWRPLRTPQHSLQLADEIRADMDRVQSAIDALRADADRCSRWLGVSAIASEGDAQGIVRLLRLLARAPKVPRAWLSRDAVSKLRRVGREQAGRQLERRRLEEKLAGRLAGSSQPFDYRVTASALELLTDEREAIDAVAGEGWRTLLGPDAGDLVQRVGELATAGARLENSAASIGASLAGAHLHTLEQIDRAADLAARVLALDPVPERWLTAPATVELEREARDARVLLEQLSSDEERLAVQFADALAELVDQEMLVRYRTDHRNIVRRFSKACRRDRRIVQGQLKTPRKLSIGESRAAVELALEVRTRRERWNATEARWRQMFGFRFRGRKTDWETLLADLAMARGVIADWGGDTEALRALLAGEAADQRRRALASANGELKDARMRYQRAAEAIDHEPLTVPETEIGETTGVARRALEPLCRVRDATTPVLSALTDAPADFDAVIRLVNDGVELMDMTEEDERRAPALADSFGALFEGRSTDWDAVSNALDWTESFLRATNAKDGDRLANHAADPRASGDYERRAESITTVLDQFTQALGVLVDAHFDAAATNWSSWAEPCFADMEAWCADLRDHAGDARAWVEYREAVDELDERLGALAAADLRAVTDQAALVPGIVRRRIYGVWLEEISKESPELRRFSRIDHEGVRTQFRTLDERFPRAARERVRERAFARYPDVNSALPAGQVGILHGELSKRRRQMPVRRLIARIPNLMQTLKPCFLMSPLAVSQYLPADPAASEHVEFDVAIFDEASQILPEDALPAIERARQVIVVGDRMQLPPTTFFQIGFGEDDAEEEVDNDDDAFEGRESILDVMVGQVGAGIAEKYLSVHYRSRCESLIRFSNHAFYDDRLLTFPSPDPASVSTRAVYLPNATYDAGGSRTNRSEAEHVADLVFQMMMAHPDDESIGVVALSRPQAEIIERLIEERRLRNRSLDDRFSDDLPERFFVKNLENVQGDERDHMILSIGYGPTRAGAVPNRFGPLNRDGGERRLNVAVTRARASMTVVHSLRAEDITSQQPGARQLRRYLEYARNPEAAFESEITGTGEPDSPFEEVVLAALRSRGHRVDAQVGVSGYRIDLAIRSEDGLRYDLGIECDGATYHRSPTARDRDRLRQEVLEGLGWRIHRVWSTAWVRDPGTEIAAIEQSLKRARLGTPEPPQMRPGRTVEPPDDAQSNAPTTMSRAHDAAERTLLFREYRRFESERRSGDVLLIPPGDLLTLAKDVIEVEQPVHVDIVIDRIRTVYRIARTGKKIRARVMHAVEQLCVDGVVWRDATTDEFLSLAGSAAPGEPRRSAGRSIGHVASAEIDDGLLLIVTKTFGIDQSDLVREAARQFGWRRTGKDIERRLSEGTERLLNAGRLSIQANMLVASDNSQGQDGPRTEPKAGEAEPSSLRSSWEIALERTKSVSPGKENPEQSRFKTEGRKLVSRYLDDPNVNLQELLKSFDGKQAGWVRDGVRDALLSNLTLPTDEFALKRSRRAGEGFGALSTNDRKLRIMLNQLEPFLQEYLGERNRIRQEVDRTYEPRRQQKEEELAKKTGQRVQINPQNDPEYVGLMRQQFLMVDDRYGEVLQGARDELTLMSE